MKRQDERGSVVVEASMTLVIFVSLLAMLISIMNIMYVHDRVQYAMRQTVEEISGYTYLYSKVGLQAGHDKFKENAAETKKNVTEVLEGLSSLASDTGELGDQLQGGEIDFSQITTVVDGTLDSYDKIESLTSNPVAMLQGFLAMGLDSSLEGVKSYILQALSVPLMKKYLEFDTSGVGGGVKGGSEFLQGWGVEGGLGGFDLRDSRFLPDNRTIDLVARYTIKLRFAFLSIDVPMVQRAAAAAWLDGDGGCYKDE